MATPTGTWFYTALNGVEVGRDAQGNRYYRERHEPDGRRRKRWVICNGTREASRVPPEWRGWLHYTVDETLYGRRDARRGAAGAQTPAGRAPAQHDRHARSLAPAGQRIRGRPARDSVRQKPSANLARPRKRSRSARHKAGAES